MGGGGISPSKPWDGGTACHVRFSTLDNPFQFTRVSVGAIHELPLQRRRDLPVEPPLGGTCLSRLLRDVGLSTVIHRARQACPSEGFPTGTRLSGPLCNVQSSTPLPRARQACPSEVPRTPWKVSRQIFPPPVFQLWGGGNGVILCPLMGDRGIPRMGRGTVTRSGNADRGFLNQTKRA